VEEGAQLPAASHRRIDLVVPEGRQSSATVGFDRRCLTQNHVAPLLETAALCGEHISCRAGRRSTGRSAGSCPRPNGARTGP
jgi:hypothetical protein